jgi:hypothetical protein
MKYLVAVVLLLGCDGSLDKGVSGPPRTVRMSAEPVTLVGRTRTSCSTGVAKPGIDGDLWCAFARSAGAATELWVLDVTQASRATVPCDGTNPRCLRLSSTLWTGTPLFSAAFPEIDGFEGDTLFIYADATSTGLDASYQGPIRAWRPGWPAARTMTSGDGFICHGHPVAAVAYCIDGVQTVNEAPEFDLRAGAIGTTAGPLASVGRIRALGAQQQLMWGAGFSPDGKYFLYSSPDDKDAEVLRVTRTKDGGTEPPTAVVPNVARWSISPDGNKLYYLSTYNYADTEPSGTLMMLDFPGAGGAPTVLQEHVGTYVAVGNASEPLQGLAFLQDISKGNGTFRFLRDRTQPGSGATLGSDVNEFLISPDLRYTYLSQPDTDNGPVGLLVSNDGKGKCSLNTRDGAALYSVSFPPQSDTVFWAQDAESGFQIEGWYAASAGCASKRKFSDNLAYLLALRDGLLFADVDSNGQTMSLKRAVLDKGALGEAQMIMPGIDTSLARGGARYAVFTISAGESRGLYAYGPLP